MTLYKIWWTCLIKMWFINYCSCTMLYLWLPTCAGWKGRNVINISWIHITDHDDSQVLNACIKGVSPTFEVKCTQSTTQLMNFSSCFYIKFRYKQGQQIIVCNYQFQETRQEVSKDYTVVIKVVSLMLHFISVITTCWQPWCSFCFSLWFLRCQ